MDELDRQLKNDAQAIEAPVSPKLRARIDASLHAARNSRPDARGPRARLSPWWMSGLTGLTAAVLIIAFLNLNRDANGPTLPETQTVATPASTPERAFLLAMPLKIKPAVLSDPLQEELENIQSDLEKARDTVARDIKMSF